MVEYHNSAHFKILNMVKIILLPFKSTHDVVGANLLKDSQFVPSASRFVRASFASGVLL